jgi:hypothetical protein
MRTEGKISFLINSIKIKKNEGMKILFVIIVALSKKTRN